MAKEFDHILRLIRRAEHLERRIASNPEKDLSYDRAEVNALRYAIDHLRVCPEGWVSVPVRPPDIMLDAFERAGGKFNYEAWNNFLFHVGEGFSKLSREAEDNAGNR